MNEFPRHTAVGSAEQHDRVVPVLVHLDDRVAGTPLNSPDEARVHTVAFTLPDKVRTILSDGPGMPHRNARSGNGDRLVQPLTAAVDAHPCTVFRLSPADDVIHRIHVIQVQ